jgi:hypothetical protein
LQFIAKAPSIKGVARLIEVLLPVAVALAVPLLPDTAVSPIVLMPASLLWLPVAGYLRPRSGIARLRQQQRFARFNRQAVATALITLAGLTVFAAGTAAVAQVSDLLLGLSLDRSLYAVVLPIAVFLAGPLYWMSRLPLAGAASAGAEGELLGRVLLALGRYVLTPLLFLYALILFIYMVQALLARALPPGMTGWMVLSFALAGGANWLMLEPDARPRGLVRWFRASWFWLILPPTALLLIAVHIRIAEHGLTPARVVLVAGGIWSLVLALAWVLRRGDIRLIPGLAAVMLTALSMGPLNIYALTEANQLGRFRAVMVDAGIGTATARPLMEAEFRQASSALNELFWNPATQTSRLALLAEFGLESAPDLTPYDVMRELGYAGSREALVAEPGAETFTTYSLTLDPSQSFDLSETPVLQGSVRLTQTYSEDVAGLSLTIEGSILKIGRPGDLSIRQSVDLSQWLGKQDAPYFDGEPIRFTFDGVDYRLLTTDAYIRRTETERQRRHEIATLDAMLLSGPVAPD